MNLIKNIFGKKNAPVKSNEAFWEWFKDNEKAFYQVVKEKNNIEENLFNKLSPKLNELKDGFYFLTGMIDQNIAELVFTADGEIKNIAFVEELVRSAPKIDRWLFKALKPALEIENLGISMAGYEFVSENLCFYAEDHPDYPDEIDLKVVHNDFDESNKSTITNGTYIFLDNFLGELNFATTIDNLTVIGRESAGKELIPIEKLKAYLIWREKEFIEKYEGLRHNTENDSYSMLKAELSNGNALIAVINTDLLEWDSKASHPWILNIEIKYDGENNKGMPDDKTFKLLDKIENDILNELKDFDGYLNIGRQTADSIREIYFACRDFRKPSLVLHAVQQKYAGKLDISYDIYKDKYWQSFNRFINQ
jgi:hypothetical protein